MYRTHADGAEIGFALASLLVASKQYLKASDVWRATLSNHSSVPQSLAWLQAAERFEADLLVEALVSTLFREINHEMRLRVRFSGRGPFFFFFFFLLTSVYTKVSGA